MGGGGQANSKGASEEEEEAEHSSVSAKQGVKETLSTENTGEAPNILQTAGKSGKLFSIISYSSQTHHLSPNLALCI